MFFATQKGAGTAAGNEYFFVAGYPRSGTTLVSVLLDRHSRLTAQPAFKKVIKSLDVSRRLTWPISRLPKNHALDRGELSHKRFVSQLDIETDEVYLKLNCEGCEVDIIEDLLDSNEYRKITSLGVAFDVKKIPSQRGRDIELKRRLEGCGYGNYVDIELQPGDSRREKMQTWLLMAGANRRSLGNRMRQTVYRCQTFAARLARYFRRRLTGRGPTERLPK